jgi:peptidoglycan hydrolase-like protein with peptidoglycan-binding domain
MKWLIDLLKALFGGKSSKTPAALDSEKAKWETGKQGAEVKEVQKKLINLGHHFSSGSDGKLGEHTEGAIEDFKEEHGIEEEGIGEETLKAIDEKYQELGISEELILRKGDDDDDFKDDGDPDNDDQVSRFQKKLIELGYDLPRFGADGSFGEESLVATKEFQDEHKDKCGDDDAFKDQGVGAKTFAAVMAAEPPPPSAKPTIPAPTVGLPGNPPEGMIVTKDDHPLKKGSGTRKLADINGVTLHQTACVLGEKESKWYNVACHIGITRDGKILHNNDFIKKVRHGNGFNTKTIGIELDGHFAGEESYDEEKDEWVPNLKTYWRPKSRPDRMPLSITDAQVEACKEAIRWVKRVVDGAGGDFKYILAHRQSSPSRVSDPGEKTWRLVVLPLLEELDMSDGGDDYYILDSKGRAGKPIPGSWDPERHAGVKYKPRTSTKGRKKYGP